MANAPSDVQLQLSQRTPLDAEPEGPAASAIQGIYQMSSHMARVAPSIRKARGPFSDLGYPDSNASACLQCVRTVWSHPSFMRNMALHPRNQVEVGCLEAALVFRRHVGQCALDSAALKF